MKKLTASELKKLKVGGPRSTAIAEELHGYYDEDAKLLGILLRDKADQDFGFVVLAPEAKGEWRAIDMSVSIESESEADKALVAALEKAKNARKN